MMRELDDKTLVSGQISPDDVAELRRHGVTMIVNNRPDGEDAGQPTSREIEAAAKAAGIDYRFVPIVRGMGPSDIEAIREALAACEGKALLYCRTGNRSALAWAVVRAEGGTPIEEIEQGAARAGFDLGPVAHLL
jgi:uncharacterized protein (TIGR01244 family)